MEAWRHKEISHNDGRRKEAKYKTKGMMDIVLQKDRPGWKLRILHVIKGKIGDLDLTYVLKQGSPDMSCVLMTTY